MNHEPSVGIIPSEMVRRWFGDGSEMEEERQKRDRRETEESMKIK